MRFQIGERVTKAACPPGCQCDGHMIPTGSIGVIGSKPRTMGSEPYYSVTWKVKGMDRVWGTYEHGIEGEINFPDISYLEGV